MEEDRMPTLFEILNRFSKPPVDLWSFYIYLKEHYGGVEYLEFWLDCAAHMALCKNVARDMIRDRHIDSYREQQLPQQPQANAANGLQAGFDDTNSPFLRQSAGDATAEQDPSLPAPQGSAHHRRELSSFFEGNLDHSPSSSILLDILHDDALDASSINRRKEANLSRLSNMSNEDRDDFDVTGSTNPKRFSTLSYERARNKRDTVSRLSEILDNMRMPEYPSATATSPTRTRKASQELDYSEETGYVDKPVANMEFPESHPRFKPNEYSQPNFPIGEGSPEVVGKNPPSTPPPHSALTANMHPQNAYPTGPYLDNAAPGESKPSSPIAGFVPKRAIRDSALRIINTYLTPKAFKEIELPSDQHGWAMAEDIRQLCFIPGGLENPKIFENATTYVFEALEREALPGFLVHRALSNVQPVSAIFRLIGGLVALFGAFWLSFVFVLLDWTPRAHRCWVILPFSFGWYLTITGLYHIDPVLAFSKMGERDGGGLMRIQERFVWKILSKRGLFVVASVVLLTAAFCVLFIFVPGHRL